jgi:hypothetical protein
VVGGCSCLVGRAWLSVVNTENSAAPIIGYIAISWDSPHISVDREDGPGYVSGTHCYLVSADWRI